MNDTTWVKLYRKSLHNEVRRHDPTAWRVFETLLLLVDSRTGKWSGGRFQLAEVDGSLNSSTIYKALQRLEKNGMISVNSNTRYSVYSICKFGDYAKAGNTSSNNKVTTNGQQSNTSSNTLTRSKEVRSKNNTMSNNGEYEELRNHWLEHGGRKLSDSATSKSAAKKLLKEHTVDEIKYAILGAIYFQGKQYKPQVLSFTSLYDKWDNLIGHMQTEKSKGGKNATNRFE